MVHMLKSFWAGLRARALLAREAGQSTTEYTLVILVAATIALLLLNWAQGGRVVAFFDTIFDKVIAMFS